MQSSPKESQGNPGLDPHAFRIGGLASRLRRITTSGLYVPEIDGLRFIAIASVILLHVSVQTRAGNAFASYPSPFVTAIRNGFRGVPLFFTISGFILGMPFANHLLQGKERVDLRRYFLRRVTRLEPPYMLVMLLRSAMLIAIIHKSFREVLPSTFASLFYLHNLIFGRLSSINPPAWSLEIEIQFYCIAPLIAYLYFSIKGAMRRRFICVAAILAGCFAQDYFAALSPRVEWSIVCYFQYFLAGFLLVDLYISDWKRIPKHWMWDGVSLLSWVWIFMDAEARVHYFLPLLIVVAFIAAFKGPLSSRMFRITWVSLIGGMCYSIYLTHNLAISLVASIFDRFHWLRSLENWELLLFTIPACFAVILVIGIALYVLVERPCMDKNWPSKLVRAVKGRLRIRESAIPSV